MEESTGGRALDEVGGQTPTELNQTPNTGSHAWQSDYGR